MPALPEEIRILYLSASSLFLIFLIFIISFVILFKKRQNELLLKNQLEEEQHKNELLSKEVENQQNLIQERERISEDIHDDIGGILSAIKLQAEFLKSKTEESELKVALDSISENTLIATSNFREMVWCLHSKNDTLSEFSSYITQYAKRFFEPTAMMLKVHQPIILDDLELSSFKRRQLLLSIKEILNNILKHSQAQLVEMEIELENKKLHIRMADDGIGISDTAKKGNGLYNINKRIASIDGKSEIIRLEKGTEIRLEIPL
jgi:two-component system sensor histidine kinase DesK